MVNPASQQQDPMKGRVLLAFVLSFAILWGYSYFYNKHAAPPKQSETPLSQMPLQEDEARVNQTLREDLGRPKTEKVEQLPDEKEVTLESSLMKVTFTTYRGAVKSLSLKKAKLIRDREVPLVRFQNPDVQPGALSRIGDLPSKADLDYKILEQGANYVLFETHYKKLKIQKRFTVRDNYALDLEIFFLNEGKKPFSFYRGFDLSVGSLNLLSKIQKEATKAHLDELDPTEVDYYMDGGEGVHFKKAIGKIKDRKVEDFELSWASIKSKYFALISKSLDEPSSALITESSEENFETFYWAALRIGKFNLNPNTGKKINFLIYAGPKDYQTLKSYNYHFESIMDFEGVWGHLSRGLVSSLRGLNSFFHNYGVAIIIMTLLIKLLFYPLSAISLKSMKEMQALKPQMDEIRKKFKDNPKKMQQETMALYKEHNIKPLAGCLPMLVQIPIFIAFYKVLTVSIELRGANFLWIQDLARPDALFNFEGFSLNILPLLNGASMFWQQSMAQTDPSQKALKYMMPIMITVFFYNLPSGLILYWLITTVATVVQQFQIQRKS